MQIKVSEVAERFGFTVRTGTEGLDNEITGVHVGDLLSWVMGRANENDAWITIQGHINIVAVAALTGVSCIIVAEGAEVNADTLAKANNEGIPVLTSEIPIYDTAKKFMEL